MKPVYKEAIFWVFVGCFVVEAGLNAIGSYDLLGGADGGIKALGLAFSGVLIACGGAWAGKKGVPVLRGEPVTALPVVMVMAALLSFGFAQWTAWRVLGVSFADGALKREVAGGNLKDWRQEFDKIGIVRPKGTVEADLNLELRKTSKTYPNGDGPNATKLRGELATIERRAELEAKIETAGKTGKQVRAGAENSIVGRVGITPEQNQIVVILLMTALVGFFANFGFALLDFVRAGPLPGRSPHVPFDPMRLPEQMRASFMPGLPPPDYGGAAGATPGFGGQGGPGAPGGGSTNIIYAGANGGGTVEYLPPRVAARRKN